MSPERWRRSAPAQPPLRTRSHSEKAESPADPQLPTGLRYPRRTSWADGRGVFARGSVRAGRRERTRGRRDGEPGQRWRSRSEQEAMYPSGNYRCIAPPHLAARYALEFWVLRSLSAARALAAEFLNQAVAAVGGA